MRKTLLVTNDFPPRPGGIQTYLHSFAKWLPGQELVVYAPAWDGAAAFDAAQPFQVVRHPGKLMVPTPSVARRAREILRAEGCDSVWFGAAAPLALLGPGLRRAGARRIVASTHGHEVGWSMLPAARQAIRRIGSTTDVITYVSRYTRGRFAAAFGAQAALELLPSGVDTEVYRPDPAARAEIRARHGLGDRPVIVCVSRLMPRKGQDVLIRALPEIRKRVPDAALLLVGGGPYRPRLEALAQQAGGDVVFTGSVPWEELPAHYAVGDVFAMPCRTHGKGLDVEALGIVFLEAAATGLPVIVGDSGGAPETVLDGETGHVVHGREVSKIAEHIADLLVDKGKAAQMGAAGRRWMEKSWQWPDRAARLRHLLDGETVYRFSHDN
ncbi:glycosyltransferase family 4 protein [Actinokineospora auranticolor]|uniref:phosphatidyl-myo-inositol dimannoside synthase n=1 Tax=Actinokineospora auranticolor TaxID=155976 RepID=A0A2S6GG55_9PSEU|nr:glycosyltransferase family 4 protein [Actinokineospora auranticolor]PPK64192.1 phosphatidylinositol alpha-1,6-mannosyltransferase [Actinokineospora auranticolor]